MLLLLLLQCYSACCFAVAAAACRQGELLQLQRWWEAYGERQLLHEQRQAELLMKVKP